MISVKRELFSLLLFLVVTLRSRFIVCNCVKVLCMCSSTCLLPVLVEEEESVQDSAAEIPTVAASMEGRKKKTLRSVCMKERKERT